MENLRITAEKKEKVRFSGTEESTIGNSLVVQRLGLCAFTARVWGSTPGRETKKKKKKSVVHCRERLLLPF